jgi:hypothetical protein
MVQESRFLGSEKTLLHLPDSVVERIVSHLPEGRDRHAASCVCASFARVVTAVKRRELQKLSVSHFVVQHPDTVIQMLRESQQLVRHFQSLVTPPHLVSGLSPAFGFFFFFFFFFFRVFF